MSDNQKMKMEINVNPYEVNGIFNPYAYLINNNNINTFINKFHGDFNMIYLKEFEDKLLNHLKYKEIFQITEYYNSDFENDDVDNVEYTVHNIKDISLEKELFLGSNEQNTKHYANQDYTAFLSLRVNDYHDYQMMMIDMYYLNKNKSEYNYIYNLVQSYKNPVKEKVIYFYRIGRTRDNYMLSRYNIDSIDVKPEYYNNELNLDKLNKIIKSNKSGLIIFSGISGSGKTSLIKYLSCNSDKKFVFLTINEIDVFSDPNATEFLAQNLRDSVVIIEDCEILLKSRQLDNNPYISTLLNVGDGLMGQLLNMKIILTYNNSESVDGALLRKGRCLFNHKFDKLSIQNSRKISKDLGHNIKYDESQILCDIFNVEDNGLEEKNKRKIGFGK